MSVSAQTYFAQIPEWVLFHPDLSTRAIQLYAVLNRFANKRSHAHPSRKALAEKCRCGTTAIDKALAELKSIGAVIVTQRIDDAGDPTSNDYFLVVADPETPIPENRETPLPENGETGIPENRERNQSHIEPEPFEPEKTLRVPRQKDHLFESVAAACDIDYRDLTAQARGPLNVAVKQLRDLDVTAGEVRERAANWPNLFPGATLTPTALAKHWPQLARARAPGSRDRFADMGRSLQARVDQVREVRNGQVGAAADEARRGLPAGQRD